MNVQRGSVEKTMFPLPSTERVLVVDDEESTLQIMTEVMQELGLEVTTAENGKEGWEKFEQHKPDLVVTDVQMPQGDGLTLTTQVMAREPSCPVIIVTGFGGEQAAIAALKAGATDYLIKPFKVNELQGSVNRACSLIRARLQNSRVIPAIVQADNTIIMDNLPEMVGGVINHMLKTLEECLSEAELLRVQVVLQELILNAIEHGNLHISSGEKNRALSENLYEELLRQRRSSPEYADRRVIVSMHHQVNSGTVQFRVRDEGQGFDWESMLRRDVGQLPMNAGSGRGIFLIRTLMPQVTYHHSGNEVSFVIHHSD